MPGIDVVIVVEQFLAAERSPSEYLLWGRSLDGDTSQSGRSARQTGVHDNFTDLETSVAML
jgi:hypothetical protein